MTIRSRIKLPNHMIHQNIWQPYVLEGDSCMMGSTVVRGETEGTVEFTGVDTFFGKTASLLQVRKIETAGTQTYVSLIYLSVFETNEYILYF
jgi:magnesium-transporting ATPase (P-type)